MGWRYWAKRHTRTPNARCTAAHPLRSGSISGLFWLTGTNKSDVESWGHCVIASDPSVSPPMGGLSETFYTNTLWRVSFTVFDREIHSLVAKCDYYIERMFFFFFFLNIVHYNGKFISITNYRIGKKNFE